MGTLRSQPPREESLKKYFHSIRDALEFMGIGQRKPSPEEWQAACKIVETALRVQSADVLDEQYAVIRNGTR